MLQYTPCNHSDGDTLAEIRARAMRESLEALGRFDPIRVRERFLASFTPADTVKILQNDQLVGFYVLRQRTDHLYLDHLYIEPSAQGKGIGGKVIDHIKQQAQQQPIRLGALKQSRSNQFYQQHGFQLTHDDEFDNYYELPSGNINTW